MAYWIIVQEDPLRQIFYHSRAVEPLDTSSILSSSKRNNGIDGITGVLLADGRAYLQVIEGPESSVLAAFDRISADPRHDSIVIIGNHLIDERDFAYWSMEIREPGQASDDAIWRLRRRLMDFDPDLHHYFFDRRQIRATGLTHFSGTF